MPLICLLSYSSTNIPIHYISIHHLVLSKHVCFLSDMSEKTLLSPSLRVENGDYHEQAAEVMRSLIRFYDSMIKLGPFMKISQTKLDKLEDRAKVR